MRRARIAQHFMSQAPITFFNRHTQQIETEQVYGGGFLRWIYQTASGQLALHAVAKRAFFSQLYGWAMDSARSAAMVQPFIDQYGLDPATFAQRPEEFESFNAFFSRKLAAGARPLTEDPEVAVFPADGRHLAVPDVSQMEHFFVKGQRFDLTRLLGSAALAERYARGTLILSRLCPVDYHRFHFPVTGVPGPSPVLPGPLFSVSPIALRQRLAYLWENKRTLCSLETRRFGQVLILEIGATNVGSILQTYRPGTPVGKGAEKGCFQFGGSSVITLFEPGQVTLAPDLAEHSAAGRELYAQVGTPMASRSTS
jgi:phosphatidylserine decarboxylase